MSKPATIPCRFCGRHVFVYEAASSVLHEVPVCQDFVDLCAQHGGENAGLYEGVETGDLRPIARESLS